MRDRIRELRRVRASELVPNPKNWRTHPEAQAAALRGLLEEVGYADALIARELEDGRLMLIDGHLRAETTPDAEVPVLVLDATEAEADKILATLDPLAALAGTDTEAVNALLASVETESEAVRDLLGGVVEGGGAFDADAVGFPDLPGAEGSGIRQMTFTVTEEQHEAISEALSTSKDLGPFVDTGNENSNGNALARIAELFVAQHG